MQTASTRSRHFLPLEHRIYHPTVGTTRYNSVMYVGNRRELGPAKERACQAGETRRHRRSRKAVAAGLVNLPQLPSKEHHNGSLAVMERSDTTLLRKRSIPTSIEDVSDRAGGKSSGVK